MDANSIAQRTLIRLSHGDVIDRLTLFLSDPANVGTVRYRRINELLDTARQRKKAANGH